MNVTPLTLHGPGALAALLRANGWDPGLSETTAGGVMPLAVRCSGLDGVALAALVRHGGSLGLDVLTGDDWAIISGSRARLGALARPWVVPEALRELAAALGPALAIEGDNGWETARGSLQPGKFLIVGILNLTPDSFSDGGALPDVAALLRRAGALIDGGAGMLDVGGESTRPGRTAIVEAAEEIARVCPAVEALVHAFPDVPVSIDTVKAEVARAALDAGAAVVNDVSGMRLDAGMGEVIARGRAGVVLMHSRGENLELASYAHADYPDGVVAGVLAELRESLHRTERAGITAAQVVLDPGLGFGKTPAQSVELLGGLDGLLSLGRPVYVGPSRKRFLGELTGKPVTDRNEATAVACALAWERGARIFRVHEPALVRDALAITSSLQGQ